MKVYWPNQGYKFIYMQYAAGMECGKICLDLPGFCESGLSMTRLGEVLPSFGVWGSTRRCPLKLAYLTYPKTCNQFKEYAIVFSESVQNYDRHQETPKSNNSSSLKMATLYV